MSTKPKTDTDAEDFTLGEPPTGDEVATGAPVEIALPPELASRFVTEVTALTPDQAAVIRSNASAIANAAAQISLLPASRERSLALTSLEESLSWANKAVFA